MRQLELVGIAVGFGIFVGLTRFLLRKESDQPGSLPSKRKEVVVFASLYLAAIFTLAAVLFILAGHFLWAVCALLALIASVIFGARLSIVKPDHAGKRR